VPRIATPWERKPPDLDPTVKVPLKSGFFETQLHDTNNDLLSSEDLILQTSATRTSAQTSESLLQTFPNASCGAPTRLRILGQTLVAYSAFSKRYTLSYSFE
jgi:hypothetical protein